MKSKVQIWQAIHSENTALHASAKTRDFGSPTRLRDFVRHSIWTSCYAQTDSMCVKLIFHSGERFGMFVGGIFYMDGFRCVDALRPFDRYGKVRTL